MHENIVKRKGPYNCNDVFKLNQSRNNNLMNNIDIKTFCRKPSLIGLSQGVLIDTKINEYFQKRLMNIVQPDIL